MPIYIALALCLAAVVAARFVKNKLIKTLLCVLALPGILLSTFFLAFMAPDIVGPHRDWLSFMLSAAVFVAGMLFVWKPFSLKIRRIIVLSLTGIFVLTAAAVTGPEIYKRSFLEIPDEEINLNLYRPFGDGSLNGGQDTLVKTLDEESSLKLTDNLPRLDGATALYPVYSAFVCAAYPEGEYYPYLELRDSNSDSEVTVVCSKTGAAFENLIDGYADVVFLMGVSDEQRAEAELKGIELILTPIGREAFIFFVNNRNAITNLSSENIREIYSGQVTDWSEVGGGNDKIRAYQRPDNSGSQTMLKQILDGSPLMTAPHEDIYDLMVGMYQRVASYRNYKNSLGYSFLYYIRDMINEDKVRFLSIDGVAPTRENIANGSYPFANDFYAVTAKYGGEYLNAGRTENIDKLIEWIQSEQGQYLVDATGYVPMK